MGSYCRLHHCTVMNSKGESYRLKERKGFMRRKQQTVNNPSKTYKISSAFSCDFKSALRPSAAGENP